MKIEKIKIKTIKPLKFNPRIDLKPEDEEYQKIKKSILEFDLVEPFIVNKRTGNLISRHQRLKILKELGKKEVEAVIVDLYKVGKLNGYPKIESKINWREFGKKAINKLKKYNKKFYIKKDLRQYLN